MLMVPVVMIIQYKSWMKLSNAACNEEEDNCRKKELLVLTMCAKLRAMHVSLKQKEYRDVKF